MARKKSGRHDVFTTMSKADRNQLWKWLGEKEVGPCPSCGSELKDHSTVCLQVSGPLYNDEAGMSRFNDVKIPGICCPDCQQIRIFSPLNMGLSIIPEQ
jgi:hypothetical protein